MSRASEWTKRHPPHFAGVRVQAWVEQNGEAKIQTNGNTVTPDEALQLAMWLKDTFGEPTP